jgi:hypothetical protein
MLGLELVGVHERSQVDHLALGRVGQDRVGWAKLRDIGRRAAFDPALEDRLVAGRDAVDLDRDAGGLRKSASEAWKLASSPPVHWTWMSTVLPLYGWLEPSALSSSV